jgi:hypothetical protein
LRIIVRDYRGKNPLFLLSVKVLFQNTVLAIVYGVPPPPLLIFALSTCLISALISRLGQCSVGAVLCKCEQAVLLRCWGSLSLCLCCVRCDRTSFEKSKQKWGIMKKYKVNQPPPKRFIFSPVDRSGDWRMVSWLIREVNIFSFRLKHTWRPVASIEGGYH